MFAGETIVYGSTVTSLTHCADDHELAASLAETAGRLLLPLREGFSTGEPLGCIADQTANAFLMSSLGRLRPDDAILSEECPDHLERLGRRRVWIIDPLDGTREYAEGRDDWAVHVALAVDGQPVAGAVSVPALGRTLATSSVEPALPPDRRPIMLVSRTRCPDRAGALAEHLGAEVRAMGSAGAKTAAVIAGEADIYFHTGGQCQWDNCAPVAVALAAGLRAGRADGSPIRYNQPEKIVPDLLIARPSLFEKAVGFFSRPNA